MSAPAAQRRGWSTARTAARGAPPLASPPRRELGGRGRPTPAPRWRSRSRRGAVALARRHARREDPRRGLRSGDPQKAHGKGDAARTIRLRRLRALHGLELAPHGERAPRRPAPRPRRPSPRATSARFAARVTDPLASPATERTVGDVELVLRSTLRGGGERTKPGSNALPLRERAVDTRHAVAPQHHEQRARGVRHDLRDALGGLRTTGHRAHLSTSATRRRTCSSCAPAPMPPARRRRPARENAPRSTARAWRWRAAGQRPFFCRLVSFTSRRRILHLFVLRRPSSSRRDAEALAGGAPRARMASSRMLACSRPRRRTRQCARCPAPAGACRRRSAASCLISAASMVACTMSARCRFPQLPEVARALAAVRAAPSRVSCPARFACGEPGAHAAMRHTGLGTSMSPGIVGSGALRTRPRVSGERRRDGVAGRGERQRRDGRR